MSIYLPILRKSVLCLYICDKIYFFTYLNVLVTGGADTKGRVRVHCAQCDRWILSYNYAQHQRRHNNERPFICDISECNKAFHSPADLQLVHARGAR